MKIFYIEQDNRIRVEARARKEDANHPGRFSSSTEWKRLAADLPLSRLVEIWNRLPKQKPVRRFMSRTAALDRIWAAVESMRTTDSKAARPSKGKKNPAEQLGSIKDKHIRGKTARMLALLKSQKGVSLEELLAVTGWQKHSVRGFLSGTVRKKLGFDLTSTRNAHGVRMYRIIGQVLPARDLSA
jgi:hypothetical protein